MTLNHKQLSEKFKSQSEALYERANLLLQKHVPPNKVQQQLNTFDRLIEKAITAHAKSEKYLTKVDKIRSTDEDAETRLEEKLENLRAQRIVLRVQEKPIGKITKQISTVQSRLNLIKLNKSLTIRHYEINGIKIVIADNLVKIYCGYDSDRDERWKFESHHFKYSQVLQCWIRKLSNKAILAANEICKKCST